MGLPWLRHPVLWHSSRVPSGYNYTAMTPEQIKLIRTPFHDWYTADYDYGRTTVYFFCAGIFLFGIVNLLFRLRHATAGVVKHASVFYQSVVYQRFAAAFRTLEAKQIYVSMVDYHSPPLSAVTIVLGMIVFFAALTFAAHPYQWPNMAMGHSPPIATRCGWISIAIMPFLIVFATKVNPIGMVVGVSHEKLQVYHRWAAWIMYITALIHTFPFIVQEIKLGKMSTDWATQPWYWTGVAALVPQTWLVFMSVGPIRNRYYEIFKKLHFVASGVFVSALFVHCNFSLTSWDYFWATAALYGVSWLARQGRTIYNGVRHEASFEALPEDMIKITVPTTLTWRPGQHYFVRFLDLGIHAATSHPFTVATLAGDVDGKKGENVMEIYARVRGGITARMAALCAANGLRSSRVLLDGPYGGVEGSLRLYDRVLLLAGGSGATFVVPLFLDILGGSKKAGTVGACRTIHLVWAVRTLGALSWFEDVLQAAIEAAPEDVSVTVSYYVTAGTPLASDDKSSADEKSATGQITKEDGRPVLANIVNEFCDAEGTVGISTCGPSSFNLDVGNAVAERQLAIARGKALCSEIYLHQENYSW